MVIESLGGHTPWEYMHVFGHEKKLGVWQVTTVHSSGARANLGSDHSYPDWLVEVPAKLSIDGWDLVDRSAVASKNGFVNQWSLLLKRRGTSSGE